jgi:hypothetical protein
VDREKRKYGRLMPVREGRPSLNEATWTTGGATGTPTQVHPTLENWYRVQVDRQRRLKRGNQMHERQVHNMNNGTEAMVDRQGGEMQLENGIWDCLVSMQLRHR